MNLEQFKEVTLDKTYGNPPPVLEPNRGAFQGQCVSYVRQYMEAVLGIPTRAWGNAKDYWTNPALLEWFDRIENGRQEGDILVWGNDLGNWTGPDGHIGIAYQGKLLNQNYSGSLRVSVNNFFQPGYLGALRFKGGSMKPTKQQVYDMCMARGFAPSEEEKDKWIAMEWSDFMYDLCKAYPFDSICKVKFVKVGDLYVKE